MNELPIDQDEAWEPWRRQWHLSPDTIYLNHGSFGPPPDPVREAQRNWKDRLDQQPMNFFVRQFPHAWQEARDRLAAFVHTSPGNLVFVANATEAMNAVAHRFPLGRGDEVLLTDHEYGVVQRIWRRRAAECEAVCRIAKLPLPVESADQICESLFSSASEQTRLMVISHITSPTAVTMPVDRICRAARDRGIPVCIDGPHAIAQCDLSLDKLDCAFYTASCHKWLSAPFGSGFLYVAPPFHALIEPPNLSWGVLPPATPQRWDEEFLWAGTRDPTAYLAIPAAIDLLQAVGLDAFRRRTHWLARYARQQLTALLQLPASTPDSNAWYGSMAHVPLPPGDKHSLQLALWNRFGIEVPIVEWHERRWIRVSCHLYNTTAEIDSLVAALRELL